MKIQYFAQQQIDELLNNLARTSSSLDWNQIQIVEALEALLLDKLRACIPLSKEELNFFDVEELTIESAA